MNISVSGNKKINVSKFYTKEKDYFFSIYTTTVSQWCNDNLSREAMAMLLEVSSGIAPGRDWTIYPSNVSAIIFDTPEKFENAFDELEEKGYAKTVNGVTYVRNDKRMNWESILPRPVEKSYEIWGNLK